MADDDDAAIHTTLTANTGPVRVDWQARALAAEAALGEARAMDDASAEVRRAILDERDAARAALAHGLSHGGIPDEILTAAERDRDAAALAEARSTCCSAALRCGRCGGDARVEGDRLAAAHDARVRREALRDDRLAMELGEALMARMSELRFRPATVEQWAGVAADALEAVCLAEAERIGGGR